MDLSHLILLEVDSARLILYAILVILAVVIFVRVAKTIMKFVIIVLLVLFTYILFTGKRPVEVLRPTLENTLKRNSIADLEAKHCAAGKEEKLICKCLVQPIKSDLNRRFSEKRLTKLQENNVEMTNEVLKSYDRKRSDINTCIKEKSKGKVKVIETIKDLLEKANNVNEAIQEEANK